MFVKFWSVRCVLFCLLVLVLVCCVSSDFRFLEERRRRFVFCI